MSKGHPSIVLVNTAERPRELSEGGNWDRPIVEEVEGPRSSDGQLVHPIGKIVGQGLGKLAVQEPTFLCLRGGLHFIGAGTFACVRDHVAIHNYLHFEVSDASFKVG